MTTGPDRSAVSSSSSPSSSGAAGRRPRSARRMGAGRWLSVLVLGLVTGAAVVLLAEPGVSEPKVLTNPGATSSSAASLNGASLNGASLNGASLNGASSGGTTTGVNGHHVHGVKALDVAAEQQPDKPLDPATRTVLREQLMVARDTAMRYPTAADAVAAGYRLVAGFGPGSGAHYIGGPMTGSGPFDPTRVQSLIYDGTSPTSGIVGLMYFGMGGDAPEGFAGPNDHWHRHSRVCTTFVNGKMDVPFPPDADVTAAQCASVGGRYMAITGWMVHAWVVPSWESPAGVFSHENPNLRCADGTYNTDKVGKCQGT